MKQLKKLFSMKVALVILGLLVVSCVAGSVIPQGEIDAYYTAAYSRNMGMLILLTGLNDVFHCWWFAVLTVFLCVNLLGCNLIHFPLILKNMRSGYTPQRFRASWKGEADAVTENPEALFAALGFRKVQTVEEAEGEYRYAVRNRIGLWGAWLTHLGLLIIIVGFALGQMFTVKYTVYGVPGQTKQVGDTAYTLTIDSFEVALRADETVEQYTSTLTLTDTAQRTSQSGETSVNHPMNAMGMKLYQNSTGWAANVLIFKGEELLQSEILCAGEAIAVKGLEDLVLSFNAFYPDYVMTEGGPATASSQLRNPAYFYTLYYQEGVLGMNVLEADQRITVEDYSFLFLDPQQYTLIQVKRDPFTSLAALGGLVMMVALLLAFYIRTEELMAVRQDDGTWAFVGRSRKGGILFKESIREKALELQKEKTL